MSEDFEQTGTVSAVPIPAAWKTHLRRFDINTLPPPTVLIGIGLANWDNVHHVPCRACKGSFLPPQFYCLVCDRWGYDHLINETPVESRILAYEAKPVPFTSLADRIAARRKAA